MSTVNLRVPGPTPLPTAVIAAMQRPMISHRGAETRALFADLAVTLARFLRTDGDILLFPGSGTGALEAAIANLFSVGDTVLALTTGTFGARFAAIARAYSLNVVELTVEPGQVFTAGQVRAALRQHPDTQGVLFTHNETSTGVTNDLQTIGAAVREHGALLLCDAVSSAGALPLEMDAWHADVVLSGTQKAWMSPPGLAIVAVGSRAWQAQARSNLPRYFWDFRLNQEAIRNGTGHVTPALSIMFALQAALRLIDAEGLENVWRRHMALGAYARRRVAALGLRLLAAPEDASDTVTAVVMPDGIDAQAVLALLREQHRVEMTSGMGPLTGRVVRIGHLGYVHEPDLAEAFDALFEVLTALGYRVPVGARAANGLHTG